MIMTITGGCGVGSHACCLWYTQVQAAVGIAAWAGIRFVSSDCTVFGTRTARLRVSLDTLPGVGSANGVRDLGDKNLRTSERCAGGKRTMRYELGEPGRGLT